MSRNDLRSAAVDFVTQLSAGQKTISLKVESSKNVAVLISTDIRISKDDFGSSEVLNDIAREIEKYAAAAGLSLVSSSVYESSDAVGYIRHIEFSHW